MDEVSRFLLAARHAEIRLLQQLAENSRLVAVVSSLVHALQRERGASNMYLASDGRCFGAELWRYRDEVAPCDEAFRLALGRLNTEAARSAASVRLFSRVAFVLHALDALPALRARVDTFKLTPDEIASTLGRLVAGLLSVVFEAADAAADSQVSRALVAMFNFMQGKELAGQERAAGVAGFAVGRFDEERSQRLEHLVEAQARCFEVFVEFSDADMVLAFQQLLPLPEEAAFEWLRQQAQACRMTDSEHTAERWFALSTARIDAMRRIEELLTARLSRLCARRIAEAEADLSSQRKLLDGIKALERSDNPDTEVFLTAQPVQRASDNSPGASAYSRSMLDLVLSQAQRIQQMSEALEAARTALEERKLIERSKGLLMAHNGLSEEQAYRLLRQTAMNQGRRLVEVAESVLSLGPILGERR